MTARSVSREVGMRVDDWEKSKVGNANSWNEPAPCNLTLERLAQSDQDGVHPGASDPPQFEKTSVSRIIFIGHEGIGFPLVDREDVADFIEQVIEAERPISSMLIARSDKSKPGMLKTAPTVVPIDQLKDPDFTLGFADAPLDLVTMALRSQLIDIQYGRVADPHGWMQRLDQ